MGSEYAERLTHLLSDSVTHSQWIDGKVDLSTSKQILLALAPLSRMEGVQREMRRRLEDAKLEPAETHDLHGIQSYLTTLTDALSDRTRGAGDDEDEEVK